MTCFQDIKQWPVVDPLPSYGRGRDAAGGRYISLIFGTNLTDVVITGKNVSYVLVFIGACVVCFGDD